jgi:hypothetical protein
MFGIPLDLDLSFLVGSTIEEVRQVQDGYVILRLSSQREIHFEGGYSLIGYVGISQPAKLLDLVDKEVVGVKVRSTTELNLFISEGLILKLFDDSTQYETIGIYPEAITI